MMSLTMAMGGYLDCYMKIIIYIGQGKTKFPFRGLSTMTPNQLVYLCELVYLYAYGTALTTILPILFLYLNTVTVTAGTFEP